jgi:hypothetical protein
MKVDWLNENHDLYASILNSTLKLFFSIKHLESSLHWWIDSEKNNTILILSAKWNNFRGENIFSNYFDHDQKLEIIIFRR